jgi:hypothetical protein
MPLAAWKDIVSQPGSQWLNADYANVRNGWKAGHIADSGTTSTGVRFEF